MRSGKLLIQGNAVQPHRSIGLHSCLMNQSNPNMPLTYRDRGTSGTQLDVLCGDLVIANIHKAALSTGAHQSPYSGSTFYVTAGPPGFEHHGTAATLEIACLGVERNWDAWLSAATLAERT